MSIVLPRRKKVDILTPSKAIQRAKDKLGPGYFDATLLECSKNAVELTKLVDKWEDIDKKRLKCIRELCLDQERLIRTLKSHRDCIDDDDPIASIDGVETADGKMITPGFRFKSNGDLKTSKTGLPIVQLDGNNDIDNSYTTTNVKTPDSKEIPKASASVDYEKEIKDLEMVLFDIYKTLLKNRIDLFKTSGGKVKTYLRGHRNEYIPPTEPLLDMYENPNDRFAFKPGSSKSEYLSRKKISNPTHRNCIGCQFRLKATSEPVKNIVRGKEDVGKRRWSYVPRGKYAESTATLSTVSLRSKPSKAISGSNVHFHEYGSDLRGTRSEKLTQSLSMNDSEIQPDQPEYEPRRAITTPGLCSQCWRSKSALSEKELRFDTYSTSLDSGLALEQSGTTLSGKHSMKTSGVWRSGSEPFSRASSRSFPSHADTRHFRNSLVDHKSRIKTLKTIQVRFFFLRNLKEIRKMSLSGNSKRDVA